MRPHAAGMRVVVAYGTEFPASPLSGGCGLEEFGCIYYSIPLRNSAKRGNPLLDGPGFSSSMLTPERLGILRHERR